MTALRVVLTVEQLWQPVPGGSGTYIRELTRELAGRYDAPRQILIDNKVHAGRAGYHVVTPLLLGICIGAPAGYFGRSLLKIWQ